MPATIHSESGQRATSDGGFTPREHQTLSADRFYALWDSMVAGYVEKGLIHETVAASPSVAPEIVVHASGAAALSEIVES